MFVLVLLSALEGSAYALDYYVGNATLLSRLLTLRNCSLSALSRATGFAFFL